MELNEKAVEQFNKMTVIPQTIDFVVKDDFVEKLPEIVSNIKEIARFTQAQTEADRNLILETEEDFENAKKRCADLNRQIKNIEDRRKQVKKAYNEPYDIFEKELKEVTAILTAAKDNLWGQIVCSEQEVKDKLEKQYRAIYEAGAEENGVLKYKAWEKVFIPQWLNKSVKADTVIGEINEIIKNTKADIDAILSFNSEFETTLLLKYKEGFNLTAIITYNNELKAEKAAKEQEKKITQENTQPAAIKSENKPNNAVKEEKQELFVIDFRVWLDDNQLKALKEFLVSNKIKYGKVPSESDK